MSVGVSALPAALSAQGQLDADLADLESRLSVLLNEFAERYPEFELTDLSCDYVVHVEPRSVEYLVCLALRL